MKAIDIVLIAMVFVLIGMIIYAAGTKKPEPFTELYFEQHAELARFGDKGTFMFTINNLENQEMTYDILIRMESPTTRVNLSEYSISLPDQTKKSFNVSYIVPSDFAQGRIIVELKNKGQSIHYWTRYSPGQANYFGTEMSLNCIPFVNITTGNITVRVRGEDFANVKVLHNTTTILNISLNGSASFNFSGINGLVDIWFDNDYYKEGIDRNLHLEYIKADSWYYEKVLVDRGSRLRAFDCEDTGIGSSLYSNGAFRIYMRQVPD